MNDLTKIEITNEDAKLFILFRKHQDEFKILIDAGFFQFKKGCAIIDRNDNGVITGVDIKARTFTRKRSK